MTATSSLDQRIDTETTVDRLRYLLAQRRLSQAAMARAIGIDSARLSKILSGRLPVTEGFINKVAVDMGISKPWLISGEGLPYERPVHAATIEARIEPAPNEHRGIAVYDIDVTAGSAELSRELTRDRIIGYVDMPLINRDCVIVRVSGNSMTPTVTDGSFVAIRPVSPSGTIFWGQIYVVLTDDYRMLKFIRRNSDPSLITLHSDNPDYDDIELPRSEIRSLFLVETVIKYDQRC